MEENKVYCSHCGVLIDSDDYDTINGEIVCADCIERLTTTCDRCGATIWEADAYGDEYTNLCRHCYENHYTRCSCCDSLVHKDDAYHLNGMTIAQTVITTRLTAVVVFMTTATNPSQYSMAILIGTSALSLKLTEQVKTATTLMICLKSPM